MLLQSPLDFNKFYQGKKLTIKKFKNLVKKLPKTKAISLCCKLSLMTDKNLLLESKPETSIAYLAKINKHNLNPVKIWLLNQNALLKILYEHKYITKKDYMSCLKHIAVNFRINNGLTIFSRRICLELIKWLTKYGKTDLNLLDQYNYSKYRYDTRLFKKYFLKCYLGCNEICMKADGDAIEQFKQQNINDNIINYSILRKSLLLGTYSTPVVNYL